MSDRAAFVSAIAASPDDDLPRLVFADWLDENGDPARAEFIRLQITAHRESEQFPPIIDQQTLTRIRELFLANYREWLRPVYEPLGQPLPTFDRPPGEPRTWLGRRLRWVGELIGMFSGRDFGGPGDEDDEVEDDDSFTVDPSGVTMNGGGVIPIGGRSFRRGFLEAIELHARLLRRRVNWTTAMMTEPVSHLDVDLFDDVRLWQRVDGPHLAHVRSLHLQFWRSDADLSAFCQAVCHSEHLRSLRAMELQGDCGSATFLDAIRSSPLGRQLTRLTLSASREAWERFAHPEYGFAALRELTLNHTSHYTDQCPGRFANSLRRQLTRLRVWDSRSNTPGWLLNGSEWERLEHLELRDELLWDEGVVAFAQSEKFPALRVLHLSSNGIQDTGAIALASSPWMPNLRALFFELNRITDTGAIELASLLDRGLGYLVFKCYFRGAGIEIADECISLPTQRRLKERYGPRIAFPRPDDGT